MATSTPWGTSDYSKKIARGVVFYGTPSHGGYHLSPTMNAKVPGALRNPKGWYEEDCDWAIVAYVFPELFPDVGAGKAEAMVKDQNPEAYTAATGKTVSLDESRVLRTKAAKEAAEDRFVSVAAFGDWHDKVPAGMVGVATLRVRDGAERYFLVPSDEYRGHDGLIGFVVDESRHQAVPAWV